MPGLILRQRPTPARQSTVPRGEGQPQKTFEITFYGHRQAHVVEADIQLDDMGLTMAVKSDLEGFLGLTLTARHSGLTRWGGALPQYQPGHLARVGRLR